MRRVLVLGMLFLEPQPPSGAALGPTAPRRRRRVDDDGGRRGWDQRCPRLQEGGSCDLPLDATPADPLGEGGPPGDLVVGHVMGERLDGVIDVLGADDGGEADEVADQSGGELAQ